MRKKLLIITLIIIVIIAIITSIILININDKKEHPKLKEEIPILKEQNINNIIFTNISCNYDGTTSILEYTIINKTKENINLGEYEIIVKDKNKEVLAIITSILNQDIKPNEEINTGTSINIDLTKANYLELVIKEN